VPVADAADLAPLPEAPGHRERPVAQAHRAQQLALAAAQGHRPGAALGRPTQPQQAASPEVQKGPTHRRVGQLLGEAIQGPALGQAPELHPGARGEGHLLPLHPHPVRPHPTQRRPDLRRAGRAIAPGRPDPQVHHRPHGHVEGPVRLAGVGEGVAQDRREPRIHGPESVSRRPVQARELALLAMRGEEGVELRGAIEEVADSEPGVGARIGAKVGTGVFPSAGGGTGFVPAAGDEGDLEDGAHHVGAVADGLRAGGLGRRPVFGRPAASRVPEGALEAALERPSAAPRPADPEHPPRADPHRQGEGQRPTPAAAAAGAPGAAGNGGLPAGEAPPPRRRPRGHRSPLR